MNKDIIKAISEFIFIEDVPREADAIMTVGGSFSENAEIAAELWKKDYAPLILIGGKHGAMLEKFRGAKTKKDIYNKNYFTECDFYKDVLLENGVNETAIYCENKSTSTRENAIFAKELVENNHLEIKKALLVCKSFHARRSLMFYQSAFTNVEFSVITFDAYNITKENWFKTEFGVQRVLGELQRCGAQFDYIDICNYETSTDL